VRLYDYWIRKIDPTRAKPVLVRDARNDGCSKFVIDTIYSACDNSGKERELAAMCSKFKKPVTKTRKEIELEEVLNEDFNW
jgi:hypothetical protein